MEWHRHRIHPLLWQALEAPGTDPRDPIQQERNVWLARERHYLRTAADLVAAEDIAPPWHSTSRQ